MKISDITAAACLAASTALLPSCADAATVAPATRPFASDRITVTVEGNGRDVILIPGLTSSREVWRGTVNAVPGYRYHLVQVNGFAGAKAGANARGPVLAPVANEIVRYIKEKGLKAPAIVGHSMGGTIAMTIAADQPALAGRVMVVDMLPQPAGLFGGNAGSFRGVADGLRDMLTSTPGGRQMLANFLTNYAGGRAKDSDPDVVAQAAHELAVADLTSKLGRIKVPFAVVYATPVAAGEATRVSGNYRTAYAGAKGARLVPVSDSGHMVMADQPSKFREALKAFLN